MKPFLLVTGDFVKTGGMDRANYAIADYLARQAAPVHLVSHRVDPQLQQYPNVIWHPVPKLAKSDFLSSFLLDAVGRVWAKRVADQGGRVLVNGGNCQWGDVNWVHYVHAAYQPESQVNRLHKVKVGLSHQHFRRAEKTNFQNAQVILTNSQRTSADLIRHNLAPLSKVHSVYYGVEPDVFYPATPEAVRSLRHRLELPLDRPLVVFIGALGDRRKGFDLLFEAWGNLCRDPDWDADLLVIGQGAELASWKQRSADAKLSERIRFLGFRSDIPNLLRASDCLIAPTRYEAYGLGVHEAICCGIPAIVSQSAGVAERYPAAIARDLLLPDPLTGEILADRLRLWRKATSFYQQQVKAWSITLRQYSWDTMAQKMLSALGEAVS